VPQSAIQLQTTQSNGNESTIVFDGRRNDRDDHQFFVLRRRRFKDGLQYRFKDAPCTSSAYTNTHASNQFQFESKSISIHKRLTRDRAAPAMLVPNKFVAFSSRNGSR
jgi:hypothetical protein